MELQPRNFYKTEYLSNTLYLVQIALEKEFSKDIMRSDPSRVIYADKSIVFRERVRRLRESGYTNPDSLNLPFVSYYNPGNWVPDDRQGFLSAKGASWGFAEESIGFQKIRFLHTKVTFECYAFFSNYLDAQLAYETLLWLDKPAPLQYAMSSVDYKGYSLDIPINLSIENLVFAPETTQKDFFSNRKIFPIRFEVTIRSVSFSQKPQPEGSSIFDDESSPVLTKRVLLDFMTYKFSDAHIDKVNIALEVQRDLTPPSTINPTVSIGLITNTTIQVIWTFPGGFDFTTIEDDITISLNGYLSVNVAHTLGSYTFENLSPESLYNVVVWVYGKNGSLGKGITSATTTTSDPLFLKGIRGY